MKRRLLLLAIAFVSIAAQAQNKSFKNEANFWLKSNHLSKGSSVLNGHLPIENNNQTALTTKIGKDHSNYYLVYKSSDIDSKDLLDLNMSCYKHTMTTQNITFHDELLKQEKIRTGAIVKQGFTYGFDSDKQFLQVILEDDQTDIYEVIYVNKEFQISDHQKIQTYLSLKYGISLVDSKNYFDEEAGELWSGTNEMSHHITGIGRNDYFQLNTLSALNSLQDNFSLAATSLNDREYILVGSNQGAWKMISKDNQLVLDTSFRFEPKVKSNTDFVFTINANILQGKLNDKGYVLYKNNDFTKPVSIGIEKGNGKVDFYLNTENVTSDDQFTIAYSSKATAEVVIEKGDINVYPNPVKIGDKVYVDFNLKRKTDVEVYVYQMDGKLIERKKLADTEQAQYALQLNQSGTYVVAVIFDGKTQIHKIAVN